MLIAVWVAHGGPAGGHVVIMFWVIGIDTHFRMTKSHDMLRQMVHFVVLL